jgi:hypothetical protein
VILRATLGAALLVAAAGCVFAPAATPIPSIDANADPELAARFPSTVADRPFTVETYRDPGTLRLAGVSPQMLRALDVEVADVSFALGEREQRTETSAHLHVWAYRVPGVSEEALADWFVPVMESQSEDRAFRADTLAGKPVWLAIDPGPGAVGNAVYVHDDTAYLIYSDRLPLATDLVAALP